VFERAGDGAPGGVGAGGVGATGRGCAGGVRLARARSPVLDRDDPGLDGRADAHGADGRWRHGAAGVRARAVGAA